MLAFIHVFSICVVATILFVAVDLGPQVPHRLCERCGNRRKTAAIISRWTERADALTARWAMRRVCIDQFLTKIREGQAETDFNELCD
jgi:predicted MarR family transcription regulator